MNITSYRVALFDRNIRYGALGQCFTTAQILLSDGTLRAWLIFYDPDRTQTVPTSRWENDPQGDPMVFIPRDVYIPHLDLLRNEHPIHLVVNGNQWTRGSLRTEMEPAGEGES